MSRRSRVASRSSASVEGGGASCGGVREQVEELVVCEKVELSSFMSVANAIRQVPQWRGRWSWRRNGGGRKRMAVIGEAPR